MSSVQLQCTEFLLQVGSGTVPDGLSVEVLVHKGLSASIYDLSGTVCNVFVMTLLGTG